MIITRYKPLNQERGSTIVEVIIALIVVTVGLLGLLGMQVYSVKGNQSAYLRSQATILAGELVDAMRAERIQAREGDFDDGEAGFRANWDARLVTILGAGAAGTLVRDDNNVSITVTWTDDRGAVVDDQGNLSGDASTGSMTFVTDI
ncbi:type IV pilus modification protein PilV [Marinobacterium stanieri]|uniref:Type IV pilus assembly protein PilV n=1 Tax=Marinobacterium stanieri TaxID=49186 RepID=A0A1N6SDA0_9GAMM|nr:type IV pilus modification protein PilV [Marinobacterium stanieri]SIQ39019.1 type IV pilus assembly protein PilV [Marinobacterium stanieri]